MQNPLQPPPEPGEPLSSKPKGKAGRTVSFVVSLIVHALVIGGATYVVTTVQAPRHDEFQSGPPLTAKPAVRPVKTDPVSERREEGAAAMVQRVMTDTPSVVFMPDMPDNSSSLDGLRGATGSGLGGFGSGAELPAAMPAQARSDFTPMFGVKQGAKTAGLMKGTFYDLKQTRDRKMNTELAKLGVAVGDGLGDSEFTVAKHEWLKLAKTNWSSSYLSKFFQAPEPLYAAHIFIPVLNAGLAPKEFGVADVVQPRAWIARYKARISPPADGVYRFAGFCDDFMCVRLDGRLVLDASLNPFGTDFVSDRPKKPEYMYSGAPGAKLIVGRRMEMKAGNFYNLDVMIGEGPGGVFYAYLLYEKEGETYKTDASGNPILPVFRLDDSPIPASDLMPIKPDSPIWRSEDAGKGD